MLYIASVTVHILAAIVWIGGMIFFSLVLIPLTHKREYSANAASLVRASGERFRAISWICLALLAITGAINLHFHGFTWTNVFSHAAWKGSFGLLLAHKLALVVLIFIISAFHDFYIGPKAAAALEAAPSSSDAAAYRRTASWLARINLLLAVAVVVLGVMLVRG